MILRHLAAVGSELRGKKVAISVSPPWFFLHDRTPEFCAIDLSLLHLSALVFSTDLSYQTKQLAMRNDGETHRRWSPGVPPPRMRPWNIGTANNPGKLLFIVGM
ncbi:MAG: hypothetical protein JO352_38450 [Chloroflexi bacterium]|nr:hypothetical protein [Chloroflexota bacterium]MBV9599863.1 hypothetical protein [Chloroflexota bacterium]